jgi:hypothetical protein
VPFTTATITHTFENADGTSASGAVTFTLTDMMTNGVTSIAPSEITATLSGGALSQALTSNVDPATWTIITTGSPTGGTFYLTWNGQNTVPLGPAATAVQVQAALNAIPQLQTVTCTGGPLPSTITVSNFPGANGLVATVTFTGGSSPGVTLTNTATGTSPCAPQNTQWRVDLRILGAKPITEFIVVPAGGGSIDLYTLLPSTQ